MKTYKVIFDKVDSYEFEVKATTPEQAREKANEILNEKEPQYTEWQHYLTEVIENGKS